MTREKYESLPLATLKELAKARKMKGVSTLKKADLIEAMISLDEQEDQEKLSEQKESSQEHLKEMQNQNREEKAASELKENKEHREAKDKKPETDMEQLDSGCSVSGILEVMPDGFGFIRSDNYLPGENDVYVSPAQIRRFGLKTGDILSGNTRIKTQSEKFSALLYVTTVNGYHPAEAAKRPNFEELTPIFPKDRIRLEQPGSSTAMRIMDLISPPILKSVALPSVLSAVSVNVSPTKAVLGALYSVSFPAIAVSPRLNASMSIGVSECSALYSSSTLSSGSVVI